MDETKEQLKREILEAISFRGPEQSNPFWVYSKSVQPGSAVGPASRAANCSNLRGPSLRPTSKPSREPSSKAANTLT
jgi:hypothetical protein